MRLQRGVTLFVVRSFRLSGTTCVLFASSFLLPLLQRNIKNDNLRVILLLLHTAQCLEQPRLSSSFSVSIGFLSLSAGARNYSELHTDGLAVAQENLLLERAA